MTPKAIAKLRRTFIAIAMASFFVVIVFMGMTSIFSNVTTVRNEAERTIDAIVDANGSIPGEENFGGGPFHEEASYGLRFFSVTFDEDGDIVDVDLSHVLSISDERALEVAEVAADPDTLTGMGEIGGYLYKETAIAGGSMVVFLDCSVQLANVRQTAFNTFLTCVGALLVTFVSVVFFSKRAVRPEVENARKQQQFMTNASHELKTPIAVIRANTELTEMMSGETEWTQSTMRQVDRLSGLVRDLMTIVRSEERRESGEGIVKADVSKAISEVADEFKAPATTHGFTLSTSLAEGVSLMCDPAEIEQLANLLLDNAIKYCDESGSIDVRLSPALIGHGCTFVVANSYEAGADVDYQRFFERFYREDEAHENQQGYGIGLSVAESICKRYNGSIKASWKAGVISFTCVLKDAS